MQAYGMVALQIATGRSLSVIYRWAKALEEGRGISDRAKRLLIAATASAAEPLLWADFEPVLDAAAEREAA
jgi:hypothetical protein